MSGADPGHIPAAAPRRRGAVLRVLAPVLAVVGLVLAFLPIGSFVAGVPALAAIVLAVVLLVVGARRLLPALTVGVAVAAVVVAVVVSVPQIAAGVSRLGTDLPNLSDTPSAAPGPSGGAGPDGSVPGEGTIAALAAGRHTVRYETLGGGAVRVTYTAVVDGRVGSSREGSVTAPHARTQRVEVGGDGVPSRFSMLVVGSGDTAIGCRVLVDGRVVSQRPAGSGTVRLCGVTAR